MSLSFILGFYFMECSILKRDTFIFIYMEACFYESILFSTHKKIYVHKGIILMHGNLYQKLLVEKNNVIRFKQL